jgi:hypothetical protein
MKIAYFRYGNPTPDSTDLNIQCPDLGTNVTYINVNITKTGIAGNFLSEKRGGPGGGGGKRDRLG